jgi:hypothetical protein
MLGYARYYRALKEFLDASPVADRISVVPHEDPGQTGNFEVTVQNTNNNVVVLHSKQHAGQGKAESTAERMAILSQIQEILESHE